jgi:hypothetical protein
MMLMMSTASADRRLFTHTYEYRTVPEGRTTIEIWHTEARDTWDADTVQAMEHVLEVEHGITDHWDAGVVFGFDQTSGPMASPFAFRTVELESRYRFADRGEWPVDVVAFVELVKGFGDGSYDGAGTAIVARDFDAVTASVNIVGAITYQSRTEAQFGYAAGISYELHPKLSLGAETYATIADGATTFAAGPGIAVAPSSHLWAAFTIGFGINDEAPALAGRFILGIEL